VALLGRLDRAMVRDWVDCFLMLRDTLPTSLNDENMVSRFSAAARVCYCQVDWKCFVSFTGGSQILLSSLSSKTMVSTIQRLQ
jgi:hypothetical protein